MTRGFARCARLKVFSFLFFSSLARVWRVEERFERALYRRRDPALDLLSRNHALELGEEGVKGEVLKRDDVEREKKRKTLLFFFPLSKMPSFLSSSPFSSFSSSFTPFAAPTSEQNPNRGGASSRNASFERAGSLESCRVGRGGERKKSMMKKKKKASGDLFFPLLLFAVVVRPPPASRKLSTFFLAFFFLLSHSKLLLFHPPPKTQPNQLPRSAASPRRTASTSPSP